MKLPPILMVIMALAIAVAVYERLRGASADSARNGERSWRIRPMFTAAEARAYKTLVQGSGQRYIVLSKVRLSDVVEPDGPKDKEWWRQYNRVSQKHLDFVIVRKRDSQPLIAVEIDGASHGSERQRERDRMKDDVLGKVGIRVLRIRNEDIVRDKPIPVYQTLLEIEGPDAGPTPEIDSSSKERA